LGKLVDEEVREAHGVFPFEALQPFKFSLSRSLLSYTDLLVEIEHQLLQVLVQSEVEQLDHLYIAPSLDQSLDDQVRNLV